MKGILILGIFIWVFSCKDLNLNQDKNQIYSEVIENGLRGEFFIEGGNALLIEDSTTVLNDFYSKLVEKYEPKNKKEDYVLDLLLKESEKESLRDLDLNLSALKFEYYNESNKTISRGEIVGIIGLSDIYFNPNKDFCVVYLKYYCGGECGSGKLVFLEKHNSDWRVNEIHTLYIS